MSDNEDVKAQFVGIISRSFTPEEFTKAVDVIAVMAQIHFAASGCTGGSGCEITQTFRNTSQAILQVMETVWPGSVTATLKDTVEQLVQEAGSKEKMLEAIKDAPFPEEVRKAAAKAAEQLLDQRQTPTFTAPPSTKVH